jgi:hypothetical protein
LVITTKLERCVDGVAFPRFSMSDTPFHLDVATGRYFFEKIGQSEVDKEMIARAYSVVAFVCPDLRIEPPRIVWISPAPPTSKGGAFKQDYQEELDDVVRLRKDTTGGFTPSNHRLREIWIRSDLTACPNLEYVVAHELRHVAQKKHCADVFHDPDDARAEGDAYPYGYEVLKRYFTSVGRLTDELRQKIDRQETETQRWFQACYPHGEYKIIQCFPRG